MRLFPGRSLATRIYLFALVCVAIAIVMLIVLFVSLRTETFRERIDHMVRGHALLLGDQCGAPAIRSAAMQELAEAGVDTAIVDARGTVLVTAGQPPPEVDATFVDQAEARGSARLDDRVVVVPMAGTERAAALVSRLTPPDLPTTYAVAIIGSLLLVMLGVSIAFARGLSRPLRRLSTAAHRFGKGDRSARTRMTRRDQLGDVGRAFDEMAERVTSLLEANRALLGAVSHELRTPISRIRVALDLAAEDPAAVHELLAGVGGDLAELERLVDDTLTMTRLETASGSLPLRVETIVPAELATRAHQGFQQRHGGRRLALHVASELPTVPGDPVLLRRALDNLLDNAARYAPKDTEVELRLSGDDDAVYFAVIDRGPGMTDDELAHAFTPFWRSDQSRARNTGGVGLGLALARQLARAHHGDITLARAPGRGLCATVRIPIAAGT